MTKKSVSYDFSGDFKDITSAVAKIIKAFKDTDKAVKDVAKNVEKSLSKVASEFGKINESAKDVNKALSTVSKQLKTVGNNAQTAVTKLNQLNKSIKSVSKDTNTSNNNLKKLNNSIKTAGTNAKNSSTKLKAATDGIKALNVGAKESNKSLKKVADTFNSFNDGAKSAKDSVKQFNNEAKRIGSGPKKNVDTTSQSIKSMREKLTEATNAVGLFAGAISGVLTFALKDAVTSFARFDASLRQFRAVSGASVQQMEAFKEVAKELGTSTRFTAQEAADAGVELAKLGFTAKESQEAITGMIDAAVASGESLETTSDVIASTVRQFGLAAKDSARVGDLIVAAANKSAIGIQDWGNSMRYLGSAAAASGQPIEDMASLLVILGNNGIKATVAGNGLQNAILRLQAPTEAGAGILEKYGVAVENSDGKMRNMIDIIEDLKKAMKNTGAVEAAGELKDLFGEVALNSMQVFFNKSAEEMQNVRKEMRAVRGDAKETADQMRQGLNHSLLELKSALEGVALAIGEKLAPTIQMIADGLKGLAAGFNALPGPMQSVIAHVGLLGAGVLGVFAGAAGINFVVGHGVTAFGKLDDVVSGRLMGTFSKATGVLKNNASMLKTVGARVGGLTTFIYLLYKGVKTNFAQMGTIVSDAAAFWSEMFNDIRYAIGLTDEKIAGFKQTLKGVLRGFLDMGIGMAAIIETVVGNSLKAIAEMSRAAGLLVAKDWAGAKAAAENALSSLKAIYTDLSSVENVNRLRERFKNTYLKQFGEVEEKQDKINKKQEKQVTTQQRINSEGKTRLQQIDDELQLQIKKIELQEQELENEKKKAKLKQGETSTIGRKTTSGRTVQIPSWMGNVITGSDVEALDEDAFYKSLRDGGSRVHRSFDLHGKTGASVKSPAAGKVLSAFTEGQAGSNAMIVVKHDDGTVVKYIHASALVKSGQRIEKGTELGKLVNLSRYGMGRSHVHLDINQHATDPQKFMGFNQGKQADFHKQEEALLKRKHELFSKAASEAKAYFDLTGKGESEYLGYLKQVGEVEAQLTQEKIEYQKLEIEKTKEYQKILAEGLDALVSSTEERFSSLSSSTLSASKAMQEQIQGFTDAAANKGLSEFEKQAKSFIETELEFVRGIEQGKLAIAEYDAEINQLQKSLSNANVSEEDKAKLNERLLSLMQDRTKAVRGVVEQEANLLALEMRHADSLDTLANDAYEDLIDQLNSSEDSLLKFNAQVKSGEVDLVEFAEKLGLNGDQLTHLKEKLKVADDLQKFRDEAEKTRQTLDKITSAFYTIGEGARAAADFISQFSSAAGEQLSNVANYAQNAGGLISKALTAAFSGDILGLIAAGVEGFQAHHDFSMKIADGILNAFGLSTVEELKQGQAFIESMARKSAFNIAEERKRQAEKAAEWELKTQKKAWSELAQAAKEHNDFLIEQNKQRLEKQERLADYYRELGLQEQIESEIQQYMNASGISENVRKFVEPVVRKAIEERHAMVAKIVASHSGNITLAQDEITRRLYDWGIETGELVAEALAEGAKSADEAVKKALADAQSEMERRVAALRSARQRMYEEDAKAITALIDAEQVRLDAIQAQNKGIEEQIKLKEKAKQQDLSEFDAADKGIFKTMMGDIDYDAALRLGLGEIHNPEGVQTGTYSDKSHLEAMEAYISGLKEDNKNALEWEDRTRKEYLLEAQRIASIQGRFAEEQLSAGNLTNAKRRELEGMRAEAYVEFQQAYREAITNRFDAEIEALEASVEANNEHAAEIEKNIDGHQLKLDELKEKYDADLSQIDERIAAIIAQNEEWVVSVERMKNGIKGPLEEIIALYNQAAAAANTSGGGSTASAPSAAPKQDMRRVRPGDGFMFAANDGHFYRSEADYQAFTNATKMAKGGVVPDGFPNDTYPAWLSSKEWVVPGPDPIMDALNATADRWFRNQHISNANHFSNSRDMHIGQIVLKGNFGRPGDVQRELTQTFRNLSYNGSAPNASYTSPLGL